MISGVFLKGLNFHQKKKFLHDVKSYFWEEPLLYKHCANGMIRKCIPEEEVRDILFYYHNLKTGDHFSTSKFVVKLWQSGFYWHTLYRDAREYVKSCDACQKIKNISRKNEMPLTTFLEVELFDIWDLDFMRPFFSFFNNKYILIAINYVSKLVEIIASPTNDTKVVFRFLKKNIFRRFGIPRAIVSDERKYFYNKQFDFLLFKYGCRHKISLSYYPQVNGQVELANRKIKFILEKMVNKSRKNRAKNSMMHFELIGQHLKHL